MLLRRRHEIKTKKQMTKKVESKKAKNVTVKEPKATPSKDKLDKKLTARQKATAKKVTKDDKFK